MKYIPSKRILVLIFILLLIGGVYWFYKAGGNLKEKTNDKFGPLTMNKGIKDSDGDGLADWEEVLWQTDKNNPDTDGDGTLDGEEVKEGRNPLVPGPEDSLKEMSKENKSGLELNQEASQYDLSEPRTAVEGMLKDVILVYLDEKLKKGKGAVLTEEDKKKLVEKIYEKMGTEFFGKTYSYDDIKILEDVSRSSLRNYANQLGNIIKKYGEPAPEPELLVFMKGTVDGKRDELQKLQANITGYRNIKEAVVGLQVPLLFQDIHLKLVNGFADMEKIISFWKDFYNDPLKATMAFQHYSISATNIADALEELNERLEEQGIVFGEGEGGRIIKQLAEK